MFTAFYVAFSALTAVTRVALEPRAMLLHTGVVHVCVSSGAERLASIHVLALSIVAVGEAVALAADLKAGAMSVRVFVFMLKLT